MNKKNVSILILIILFVLSSFIVVRKALMEKYQNSIRITPEEVVNILKEDEQNIVNEKLIDESNPGPMGFTKNGVSFDLERDQQFYRVCVIETENWNQAIAGANSGNQLDEEMNGGFSYSTSFGQIVIVVYPTTGVPGDLSYRELANELGSILKKNYKVTNESGK